MILEYLAKLLQDLRLSNTLSLEKLQVDCHTSRITVKTSKQFQSVKLNWNFYIISTEPEIFMKHFSLPAWRGLLHFYRLSQGQNSHAADATDSGQNQNHSAELPSPDTINLLPIEDAVLKDLFR